MNLINYTMIIYIETCYSAAHLQINNQTNVVEPKTVRFNNVQNNNPDFNNNRNCIFEECNQNLIFDSITNNNMNSLKYESTKNNYNITAKFFNNRVKQVNDILNDKNRLKNVKTNLKEIKTETYTSNLEEIQKKSENTTKVNEVKDLFNKVSDLFYYFNPYRLIKKYQTSFNAENVVEKDNLKFNFVEVLRNKIDNDYSTNNQYINVNNTTQELYDKKSVEIDNNENSDKDKKNFHQENKKRLPNYYSNNRNKRHINERPRKKLNKNFKGRIDRRNDEVTDLRFNKRMISSIHLVEHFYEAKNKKINRNLKKDETKALNNLGTNLLKKIADKKVDEFAYKKLLKPTIRVQRSNRENRITSKISNEEKNYEVISQNNIKPSSLNVQKKDLNLLDKNKESEHITKEMFQLDQNQKNEEEFDDYEEKALDLNKEIDNVDLNNLEQSELNKEEEMKLYKKTYERLNSAVKDFANHADNENYRQKSIEKSKKEKERKETRERNQRLENIKKNSQPLAKINETDQVDLTENEKTISINITSNQSIENAFHKDATKMQDDINNSYKKPEDRNFDEEDDEYNNTLKINDYYDDYFDSDIDDNDHLGTNEIFSNDNLPNFHPNTTKTATTNLINFTKLLNDEQTESYPDLIEESTILKINNGTNENNQNNLDTNDEIYNPNLEIPILINNDTDTREDPTKNFYDEKSILFTLPTNITSNDTFSVDYDLNEDNYDTSILPISETTFNDFNNTELYDVEIFYDGNNTNSINLHDNDTVTELYNITDSTNLYDNVTELYNITDSINLYDNVTELYNITDSINSYDNVTESFNITDSINSYDNVSKLFNITESINSYDNFTELYNITDFTNLNDNEILTDLFNITEPTNVNENITEVFFNHTSSQNNTTQNSNFNSTSQTITEPTIQTSNSKTSQKITHSEDITTETSFSNEATKTSQSINTDNNANFQEPEIESNKFHQSLHFNNDLYDALMMQKPGASFFENLFYGVKTVFNAIYSALSTVGGFISSGLSAGFNAATNIAIAAAPAVANAGVNAIGSVASTGLRTVGSIADVASTGLSIANKLLPDSSGNNVNNSPNRNKNIKSINKNNKQKRRNQARQKIQNHHDDSKKSLNGQDKNGSFDKKKERENNYRNQQRQTDKHDDLIEFNEQIDNLLGKKPKSDPKKLKPGNNKRNNLENLQLNTKTGKNTPKSIDKAKNKPKKDLEKNKKQKNKDKKKQLDTTKNKKLSSLDFLGILTKNPLLGGIIGAISLLFLILSSFICRK